MSPCFSIIIPVYNVAPYLRECLDSVLAQTFADWECICVDDGSTDGSDAILDEYATADSRFRIIHRPNAGVSSARNAALDVAQGEWIWFVDGDDMIHPLALQYIADKLRLTTDVNVFAFVGQLRDTVSPKVWPSLSFEHFYVTTRHGIDEFMLFRQGISNCIYRSTSIGMARFAHLTIGEDVLFFTTFFWYSQRIAIDEEPLCFYRTRQGSTTRSKATPRKVNDHMIAERGMLEGLLAHVGTADLSLSDVGAYVRRFRKFFVSSLFESFFSLSNNERRLILGEWVKLQKITMKTDGAYRNMPFCVCLLNFIPSGWLAKKVARFVLLSENDSALRCMKRFFMCRINGFLDKMK